MNHVEINARRATIAFAALEKALHTTPLPDGNGDFIKAHASEFMLVSIERFPEGGKRTAFKHWETRNYLWLEKGKIRLGDGTSPFQKHEFKLG